MKPVKKSRSAAVKALRGGVLALGSISVLAGLWPLPFRVFHMGVIGLLGFGVCCILLVVLWDRFDGWGRIPRHLHEVSDLRRPETPVWWRRTRKLIGAGLLLCVLGGGIISVFMGSAIQDVPGGQATVVVLGCRVYGNQPSLMLQRRLDAALGYLQEYPAAPVICTGGVGEGETYSEALVMASYLVNHGIDESRIYLDERSGSTRENLRNAAEIIRVNGLPEEAAIATDGFHELRGKIYAQQNGLTGKALPAVTPWGIAPAYWVREWFGVVFALIFR